MLRDTYLDWPHEVSIETFAKCNASCGFCPYTTMDRIGTKMPDEMLAAIVAELKDHPHPFMISPFKLNEPLLDKRLLPLCRLINREIPNAHLRIFTNGSPLVEKYMDEIADLERVVHLWVSLNECDADAYRATMGLDFEKTCANLDLLHVKKAVGVFNHPVMVSKVRKAIELDESDYAFERFIQQRWPLFGAQMIKPDSWLGQVDRGSDEIPDGPCGRWFELSIMATGKVALCCMDGTGEHAIGDFNTHSLFEIYNQRHWRERRRLMLSRKKLPVCSTCTY